jgi:hypothetical protein
MQDVQVEAVAGTLLEALATEVVSTSA